MIQSIHQAPIIQFSFPVTSGITLVKQEYLYIFILVSTKWEREVSYCCFCQVWEKGFLIQGVSHTGWPGVGRGVEVCLSRAALGRGFRGCSWPSSLMLSFFQHSWKFCGLPTLLWKTPPLLGWVTLVFASTLGLQQLAVSSDKLLWTTQFPHL